MRALVTIAVIGLLAAAVSAQSCTVAEPSLDPFEPSTCAVYTACDATFCACSGAAGQTNATTCLRATSANCSTVQTCLLAYTTCLQKIEANRTSAVAACNASGTRMHTALLAAAGTYAGSSLQQSCRFRVCEVMAAFRTNCTFGTNDSNVCQAPATAPPTTTSFAIRATLRLSGSAYAKLLNNASARAILETALQTDLGTLLGISPSFIRILNMSVGSLVVDFAILNGSGKSVSQLSSGLAQATANANWLTSTKSIYATVSNETIGVLSLTVTEADGSTPAPTTVAPTTTASVSSNAAATSVVAAAAVALAALLL